MMTFLQVAGNFIRGYYFYQPVNRQRASRGTYWFRFEHRASQIPLHVSDFNPIFLCSLSPFDWHLILTNSVDLWSLQSQEDLPSVNCCRRIDTYSDACRWGPSTLTLILMPETYSQLNSPFNNMWHGGVWGGLYQPKKPAVSHLGWFLFVLCSKFNGVTVTMSLTAEVKRFQNTSDQSGLRRSGLKNIWRFLECPVLGYQW